MARKTGSCSRRRETETRPVEREEISKIRILQELIACPRQPGNLRISRKACGSRYLLAAVKEGGRPHGDFAMALRWGLELCRNCPVGRANAATGSERLSGHKA